MAPVWYLYVCMYGRVGGLVGWLVVEEDCDSWAVSLHLTASLHMIVYLIEGERELD